jgi:hypothetical protein
MWADTLLEIERTHVLRLLLWGALGFGSGVLVVLVLKARRLQLPLLRHFAIQNLVWGTAELIIGGLAYQALGLRDLTRATHFVNLLWLETGLSLGAVAVGVTLAAAAWKLGRRDAGIGAGMAIAMQGMALLVLHGRTLSLLSRWM